MINAKPQPGPGRSSTSTARYFDAAATTIGSQNGWTNKPTPAAATNQAKRVEAAGRISGQILSNSATSRVATGSTWVLRAFSNLGFFPKRRCTAELSLTIRRDLGT